MSCHQKCIANSTFFFFPGTLHNPPGSYTMGSKFSHCYFEEGSFDDSKVPIDPAKVGDLYIISYNQLPNLPINLCTEDIHQKRGHHSVMIDLYGESDEKKVIGTEIHLGVYKRSMETFFLAPCARHVVQIERLILCKKLGKIHNIGGHSLNDWALALHKEAGRIYTKMVDEQGGSKKWSAYLNSQQYARRVCLEFGVNHDDHVAVVGDIVPTAVDYTLACTLHYPWTNALEL